MENEQLTFIVPAYNAENTLATTLDSIVRQISPSWRIIIVNDGSTDKTEDIAQEYVRKISRERSDICISRIKDLAVRETVVWI